MSWSPHLLRGRRFHHWLVLAVICLAAIPTWADEVDVRNGDRLHGEVMKMEDNVLTLNTEYGQMKIDWGKVVRVTSTKPMRVRVPGEPKGVVTDFFLGGHEFRQSGWSYCVVAGQRHQYRALPP